MIPIKHLPSSSRPRERLERHGASSLSLEDLIAVLIRTGTQGADVMETSRRIADALLAGITSVQQLSSIPGIGPAKASVISAALGLSGAIEQRSRRCLLEERNARWIGQLETLFQDGPCLVAVGAVHLVGAEGLIAALRRDGYTVEAMPL